MAGDRAQRGGGGAARSGREPFMTETARDILDRVSSWPQEDIGELAEMARTSDP